MRIVSLFLLSLLSLPLLAAPDAAKAPPAATPEAAAKASQPVVPVEVQNALKDLVRTQAIRSFEVSSSPVKGIYEAIIDGSNFIYVTEDGRYVFAGGDLLDLKNNATSLTEERRNQIRHTQMAELNEKDMIVFAPKGEVKYELTIFTDVDCFYCVKLHKEVDKLNQAGVKVRYVAFPRAGVGSPAYKKMVSVWCAKDPQQALTDAKNSQPVADATCDNPVAKQFELGQRMGVSGTPALLMPNGKLVPGYMPADRLVQTLAQES